MRLSVIAGCSLEGTLPFALGYCLCVKVAIETKCANETICATIWPIQQNRAVHTMRVCLPSYFARQCQWQFRCCESRSMTKMFWSIKVKPDALLLATQDGWPKLCHFLESGPCMCQKSKFHPIPCWFKSGQINPGASDHSAWKPSLGRLHKVDIQITGLR